jgi:ATP adenylyltransferase
MPAQTPDPSDPASNAPPQLQAPWRLSYLEALGEQEKSSGQPTAASGSFLREYWLHPEMDEKNHVVHRALDGLILLNAFPYSNGHLLVALGEPAPRLLDYTREQRGKLWELTAIATDLLERTLNPQGINLGINQGRAAGAGIPQHLHVHLVPRWGGDVNFISVVGNIRVIPSSMEAMARRFRETRVRMGL